MQDSERPALEERRLAHQIELDGERTALERNQQGQFATPPVLARDIVHFALSLHQNDLVRFLEPSCGSGAFYSALLEEIEDCKKIESAVGVELDERFASLAEDLWADYGLQVMRGDFTKVNAADPQSTSLVIANPPYVRHHHLEKVDKIRMGAEVRSELGITPSGLSGLYLYFLLLSHRALAPGAVSAWLIPSEFLDVNYGRALKEYLATRVTVNRIHRFDPQDVQFDDALVTSSVVIFTNERPRTKSLVEFTHGGSVSVPREVSVVPNGELEPSSKWSPYFTGRAARKADGYTRFNELFKIRRGIATGNNKFFVLPRDLAVALGIKEENLKPMLPGPRFVKAPCIESDELGYPVLDRQLVVIHTDRTINELAESDPALTAYLGGADEKTLNGYLVKQRTPWYKQEKREPSPFLITYMGRGAATDERPFKFILNRSRAIASNMYLMLYPIGPLEAALSKGDIALDDVHAALLSLTAEDLRDGGRVYGGGLHKMEPKELAAMDATIIADLIPKYESMVRAVPLF